ncbi:MAG TPA: endonuclease, partial [Bacteroidales bacterium]|nr:endonuclease [Bacteroidales bacterium]
MRGVLLLFINAFLLCLKLFYGQGLISSANKLYFGVVYENKYDSMIIKLYNISSKPIFIKGVSSLNIYNSKPFWVSDSIWVINENDSIEVTIYCKPYHNIYNNSELIFHTSNGMGDLRVDVRAQGRYSKNYYKYTENLIEQELKDTLKYICSNGHKLLSYNMAKDSMYMIIDNEKINGQGAPENRLHCVYTNKECSGYTDVSYIQNSCNINCEHTWPQSFFCNGLESNYMKSDIHHLFPCDASANSTRSNHPFGIVTNPTSVLPGGSLYGGGIFEPRDAHKGKASRAIFYFVTRYGNCNIFLDQQQENILRLWSKKFPPDSIEIRRNEDIYRIQKNRNPFVDYPQFLERITSLYQYSQVSIKHSIEYNDTLINYGYIPAYTDFVYNYIIVNSGNTIESFTNFTLSNNQLLSFAYGNNDTVIAPGEALEIGIKINVPNQNVVNEYFTFNTSLPGMGVITVPILANSITTDINSEFDKINSKQFKIYPNPAFDFLNIEVLNNSYEGEFLFNIYDKYGRLV